MPDRPPMRRQAPTVLLTRPETEARRFAARLGDLPCVIAPLLRIEAVAHDAAQIAAAPAVVFTSAQAVAFAGAGRGRPAWCVGPRTGQAAQGAGWDLRQGPGDAAGLVPMLVGAGVPLLHVRGRHAARDLGEIPGLSAIIVYDQVPVSLSAEGAALLAGTAPVLLPLFSPRSARLAAAACRDAAAPLWLAPISDAAAAAWDGPAPQRLLTAQSPDADGVLGALTGLLSGEQSPAARVVTPGPSV